MAGKAGQASADLVADHKITKEMIDAGIDCLLESGRVESLMSSDRLLVRELYLEMRRRERAVDAGVEWSILAADNDIQIHGSFRLSQIPEIQRHSLLSALGLSCELSAAA